MRFIVALALLLPSSTLAQTAKPAEQPAAEKQICRLMDQTGSIMRKRECHTKAEWAEIAARSTAAREKLDRDYGGRTGAIGLSAARN